MHELLEMDERINQLSYLVKTMDAHNDAMINGDEEVSGEAWLIPISVRRGLSNDLTELLQTCIVHERERKQPPVMAR